MKRFIRNLTNKISRLALQNQNPPRQFEEGRVRQNFHQARRLYNPQPHILQRDQRDRRNEEDPIQAPMRNNKNMIEDTVEE